MLIDPAIDCHVHTRLCGHASGEPEEYVQAALRKGLTGIVFLEHLETGIDYFEATWLSDNDFDYYFTEGRRLRRKYRHRLDIRTGIEVGYNPHARDRILARLAELPYDFLGISYHFLARRDGHLNMVSRKRRNLAALEAAGVEAVVNEYLEGLRGAVEYLPGDMVCHLDAVARHLPGIRFSEAQLARFRAILAAAGRKGMTLEVNTSGYAHRNEPYPALFILREAVQRNIPLAAGSDAHRPADVGRHFDRLPLLADKLQAIAG